MTASFYIGYFGWLLFIAWEVHRNYKIIEVLKERPNYLNSFIIRAFFGFVALVLMCPYLDPAFFWTWVQCWPEIVYLLSSFYFIFDPWLSLKRGLRADYQGKNSGMFFDRLPKWAYYTIKIVALAGLIVSNVMIW